MPCTVKLPAQDAFERCPAARRSRGMVATISQLV